MDGGTAGSHSAPRVWSSAPEKNALLANLTKEQIENCPSIDLHKPVSRQYEEEYYRYFGWPNYWQGDGLWGMSGFPIFEFETRSADGELPAPDAHAHAPGDPHLISVRSVLGFRIHASDGAIGHAFDFLMDTESWALRFLVIKTGLWLSEKEVELPTQEIINICYDVSTVFVSVNREAVTCLPVYRPELPDEPVPVQP